MSRDNYTFTSESVSEGHPDKVCDRISDAILDAFLAEDPMARVACETLTTTNQIVLAGEVRCAAEIDDDEIEAAARDAPETQRQRRYGFRRGFLASLMVMVLLLLPYILSEEFSARFPAAAPAIMRYSAGIDSLHIWMDDRMKSTTESMRGTSTE